MAIIQGNVQSSAISQYEINQSLRFNSPDSSYLSRTPSVAGDRRRWTFSTWVKRGNLGTSQQLFVWNNGAQYQEIILQPDNTIQYDQVNGSAIGRLITNQVFRDTQSWYHLLFIWDSSNSIGNDRMIMYVNGERISSFSSNINPPQNTDSYLNNAVQHRIGLNLANSQPFDGYLAETHFIDGQALTPDNFGEFDATYGHWKPIAYEGTYGTNGFYLPYDAKYGFTEDMIGNYDGTNYGATLTYDADYGDNVASFDGNDYIKLGTPLLGNHTFSISGWFKHRSGLYTHIFSNKNSSVGYEGTALVYYSATGALELAHEKANGASAGTDGINSNCLVAVESGVTANDWHFVCCTVDVATGVSKMYINGVLSDTQTWGALSLDGNQAVGNIGAQGDTQYNSDALIADLRFYDKVLGSTEVTALYNKEEVTDGLIAHYPLNSDIEGFKDSSGNSNNFTANNLATTDIVKDSPTNNFATLNPLDVGPVRTTTYSEGNLKSNVTNGDLSFATITSENIYCEFLIASSNPQVLGIKQKNDKTLTGNRFGYVCNNGSIVTTVVVTTVASSAIGDIIAIAVKDGNISWYKNGVLLTTQEIPSNITEPIIYISGGGGSTFTTIANFGQDSSFAGNKTPQGYTDANGIGDFYYEPPAGYLALCTANLPEPTVVPSENFNVVTYTGDGSTPRSFSSYSFSPDFLWFKQRSGTEHNAVFDIIRGANQLLRTNQTIADSTVSQQLLSFDSNGFTIGSNTEENENNNTYVNWAWKAGGTPVTNTDGTITSQVSANADAGFSIVKFTGDGTGSGTVGHGLSKAPEVVLLKSLDVSGSWYWMTNAIDGSSDFLTFTTSSKIDTSMSFGSSTFQSWVGYSSDVISYCFHSVEGYSKIGTYTGNGSTDGTFVYCGFRPRYVMIKNTNSSTDNWTVIDVERDGYNDYTKHLMPNLPNAEYSTDPYYRVDLVSNGFKIRNSGSSTNGSTQTHLFYAIAETPFKYSTAK